MKDKEPRNCITIHRLAPRCTLPILLPPGSLEACRLLVDYIKARESMWAKPHFVGQYLSFYTSLREWLAHLPQWNVRNMNDKNQLRFLWLKGRIITTRRFNRLFYARANNEPAWGTNQPKWSLSYLSEQYFRLSLDCPSPKRIKTVEDHRT